MALDDQNQRKLMEMVVGKVLNKHNVNVSNIELSTEEKENIKNIVQNIQSEVEKFLTTKQVTEADFAQGNPSVSEKPKPKTKQIQSQNDVSTVKTFMNQYKNN